MTTDTEGVRGRICHTSDERSSG